jgi:putative membrane protein
MTGRTRDPDYIQPMELDPSGTVVVVPEERSTGPHPSGELVEGVETPDPVPAPRRWAVAMARRSAMPEP